METPDFIDPEPAPAPGRERYAPASTRPSPLPPGFGERLTWVTGLVLMLSALTGWYTGSGDGLQIAVIGWHTGVLGKLVFFIGFALVVLTVMAELGMELPAAVPDGLVVIALGSLATIFVLIRLISIPEDLLPADGRGLGLYISLVAALIAIAAGIVRASEEL